MIGAKQALKVITFLCVFSCMDWPMLMPMLNMIPIFLLDGSEFKKYFVKKELIFFVLFNHMYIEVF
jgi:hypothetical protein